MIDTKLNVLPEDTHYTTASVKGDLAVPDPDEEKAEEAIASNKEPQAPANGVRK